MLKPNGSLGGYQLIRSLGKGGMAEVFLALNPQSYASSPEVALKVIHPHLSQDREFVEMLIDEATLSSQLKHPNIVNVHRLGQEEGLYFIEMDFIDGCDVYQALVSCEQRRIKIDYEVAAWVIKEACAGLHYAHTKLDTYGRPLNIIHRDISPQNIQLSYSGEVKIVDFGIAKAEQRNSHTQQGVIKGKYSYMSPEQAWGDQIDHRSDIFSLGVCLFEMIAGEVLYDAEDGLGLLEQVRLAQIPNLRAIRPDLPIELEQIVYRALQAEPSNRFSDAEHMHYALESYLSRSRTQSGNELLISFMKTLGLSSSTASKVSQDASEEERTRAVSAGMFAGLSSSMSSSVEDFGDEDKTKAVGTDLFAGLSVPNLGLQSTPAPVPMSNMAHKPPKSSLFAPTSTAGFADEEKTKAVSAELFAELQPTQSINHQAEEKTRAVSLASLQGVSNREPTFNSALPKSNAPRLPTALSPPPPPPPSMLATTESATPLSNQFEIQEKTKAMSVDVASQLLSSMKPPTAIPTEQPIASSHSFPSPMASGSSSFPSPMASGSSSFPSPIASGSSSFPSPMASGSSSFPSPMSSGSSDEGIPLNPMSSPELSETKDEELTRDEGASGNEKLSPTSRPAEKVTRAPKKKSKAPKSRARGKRQSKLFLSLGAVVILVALGFVFGPKLFKPALPLNYTLSVSANAQGAKVFRDGQDTGQFTPALLQGLKPNIEYLIKVDAPGYEAKTRSIKFSAEELAKQKERSMRLFMKRAKGTLRVKSSPSSASVYMKGAYLGKTPIYKRNIDRDVGGVELKFRKDGCDPKVVILQWGEDLESLVEVSMKCR